MLQMEKTKLIKEIRETRKELQLVRKELENDGKSFIEKFIDLLDMNNNYRILELQNRKSNLINKLKYLENIKPYDIFEITDLGNQEEKERLEFTPIGKITKNSHDEDIRSKNLKKDTSFITIYPTAKIKKLSFNPIKKR